jgi:hypothetical protein
MLLGGRAVFMVGDPFIGELRHFVAEGRSLPATVQQFGLRPVASDLASLLLLAAAAITCWRRQDDARLVLGVLTLVTATLAGAVVLCGPGQQRAVVPKPSRTRPDLTLECDFETHESMETNHRAS